MNTYEAEMDALQKDKESLERQIEARQVADKGV